MSVLQGGRRRRRFPSAALLWQLAVCVAAAIAATWLVLRI